MKKARLKYALAAIAGGAVLAVLVTYWAYDGRGADAYLPNTTTVVEMHFKGLALLVKKMHRQGLIERLPSGWRKRVSFLEKPVAGPLTPLDLLGDDFVAFSTRGGTWEETRKHVVLCGRMSIRMKAAMAAASLVGMFPPLDGPNGVRLRMFPGDEAPIYLYRDDRLLLLSFSAPALEEAVKTHQGPRSLSTPQRPTMRIAMNGQALFSLLSTVLRDDARMNRTLRGFAPFKVIENQPSLIERAEVTAAAEDGMLKMDGNVLLTGGGLVENLLRSATDITMFHPVSPLSFRSTRPAVLVNLAHLPTVSSLALRHTGNPAMRRLISVLTGMVYHKYRKGTDVVLGAFPTAPGRPLSPFVVVRPATLKFPEAFRKDLLQQLSATGWNVAYLSLRGDTRFYRISGGGEAAYVGVGRNGVVMGESAEAVEELLEEALPSRNESVLCDLYVFADIEKASILLKHLLGPETASTLAAALHEVEGWSRLSGGKLTLHATLRYAASTAVDK